MDLDIMDVCRVRESITTDATCPYRITLLSPSMGSRIIVIVTYRDQLERIEADLRHVIVVF